MKTEIVSGRDANSRAVKFLRDGEIVALPTETVYGLAADAFSISGVGKIFAAKERPSFDPLIVHLPDAAWLARVANVNEEIGALVRSITEAFWPGPLTVVLPRREIVPNLVTAGLTTVAVRVSAHPIFAEIIREFGSPLAAPSANRFGRISPTSAEDVRDELDGRIPLIVDGGPTTHGIESTIVAPRNGRLEILRHGPITEEDLRKFGEVVSAKLSTTIEAPGQLSSHYAPRTPLVLTKNLKTFRKDEKRIGILDLKMLSEHSDLREVGANLYRALRRLDEEGFDLIVAEEIPEAGLGATIMDRLRRAAAR